MRILGLDLSITSPGFCIMDVNDDYTIKNISLHGFTHTLKWIYSGENLVIHPLPKNYNNHSPHYRPTLVYDIIFEFVKDIDYVSIEDYAFAGKGKVFDLAEFAGGMKNYFYLRNIPTKKLSPATVKQCATGNGGADKVMIGMAFRQSSLSKLVNPHIFNLPEYDSPQEDLVDSLYMANVLRCELCYGATGKFPSDIGMNLDNSMMAIVTGKKGSDSKPSIEHPIITFGDFSRVQKKKKKKKEPKEPTTKPARAPKAKLKVNNP